jgi:hypothetical protein
VLRDLLDGQLAQIGLAAEIDDSQDDGLGLRKL